MQAAWFTNGEKRQVSQLDSDWRAFQGADSLRVREVALEEKPLKPNEVEVVKHEEAAIAVELEGQRGRPRLDVRNTKCLKNKDWDIRVLGSVHAYIHAPAGCEKRFA